ncbi:MAG: hypothetical protein HYT98_01150 [Candidatus Sungbacteria bacterium]|nr:hypothetical protein [Candidatus Sungbacteria bacterium]
MNESLEKNKDLENRRRAVLEEKMTELSLAQKRLNFGFGNMEDTARINESLRMGKEFQQLKKEFEALGGSWEDVKARKDKEMWDKIEEKRRKENSHDRLAA